MTAPPTWRDVILFSLLVGPALVFVFLGAFGWL